MYTSGSAVSLNKMYRSPFGEGENEEKSGMVSTFHRVGIDMVGEDLSQAALWGYLFLSCFFFLLLLFVLPAASLRRTSSDRLASYTEKAIN